MVNYLARTKCPVCLSLSHEELYSIEYNSPIMQQYLTEFYDHQGGVEFEYLNGMQYILLRCNQCGLYFQKEVLDEATTERLYERWISPELALARHKAKQYDSQYSLRLILEFFYIRSLFSSYNSISALDFGMGWGFWCRMAKLFGINAYGMEISESRIQYAKQFGIDIVTWDELPQHHFDFINTEQVFEHLANPLETLLHLKSALKPNGIVKISVPNAKRVSKLIQNPNWDIPHNRLRSELNAVAPLEHLNGFTYSSLLELGKKAGLTHFEIPLLIRYKYILDPKPFKNLSVTRQVIRNLLLPMLKHKAKSTYLFFQNA